MKVYNARIEEVTVGLDEYNHLSAMFKFKSQHGSWKFGFILTDLIDAQRLVRLMKYTGVYNVLDLEGKIIRTVLDNNLFRGFGDPIEDKFIPVCMDELKEVTEKEFEEILKNK